jgi:xanthine dehydrogenase YagS FAD-binding subunit
MRNFAYVRPASVTQALEAVAESGAEQPRFLAGGTTLVDLMRLNVLESERLIDITSIGELQTFDTSGASELVFGALSKMSDVAEDPTLRRDYPAIAESLQQAASQQVRNMATLGGNLFTADPLRILPRDVVSLQQTLAR